MKLKTIAFLLLLVIGVGMFAGCLGGGTSSDTTSNASEEPDNIADISIFSEYVQLGEYKKIELQADSLKPSESDIEATLNDLLTITKPLTEGTIQDGDTANISYDCLIDNIKSDLHSAVDVDITIGSGAFVDGFENGLVGKKIDEEFDLPIAYPGDYSVEELKGKSVVYKVTVNSISRTTRYAKTDEDVAKATNGKYTTVEDYQKFIETKLYNENLTESAWEKVLDNSKMTKDPEKILKNFKDDMQEYYETLAASFGMTFEEYLQAVGGMTIAQYEEEANALARETVKRDLVVYAIAKAQEIPLKPTNDEYNTKVAEYAATHNLTVEQFEKEFDRNTINSAILLEKVKALISSNATVS